MEFFPTTPGPQFLPYPVNPSKDLQPIPRFLKRSVEKNRQQRSQRFAVLTCWPVRSGRQTVCGLARGKARLGVHGLGG
jgi:hypothetical protein